MSCRVCVRERERERVCERERECVCEREWGEGERECVCVSERKRERECVCVVCIIKHSPERAEGICDKVKDTKISTPT